ncbi:MAG: YggS family pyridoxal phosphate-dependent enzyme [Clostridia bacterium]|nr:YggS family pyridoxal phosphate-dependent enzyme [Clostridia bacterium]
MTEAKQAEIRENIARIRKDLADYPNTNLMAVIKTRTAEEINFVIRECGITLVGENRVQELLSRYEEIDKTAEVHFIGTLQKNKVKYIIDKVDMIESLDSEGLAEEIQKRAEKIGKIMPVLIEVNIGREEAKSGIFPEALDDFCRVLSGYPNISVHGLMTIAPVCEDKNEYNRYFSEMNLLKNRIFPAYFPQEEKPILSMGMSGSFSQALENGSDIIRIGEGIFGKRNVLPKKE